MLCSNFGNENSDEGRIIKCSHEPQVPCHYFTTRSFRYSCKNFDNNM